jgi:iron complex outermembrane receptor protein
MRIYFMLLALLLAGSWYAQSQNTLSGRVATLQNQPLDGAHIHIGDLTAFTNPEGHYHMAGLPAGSHNVIIEYIGYKTIDTIINITGKRTLNAVLKPEVTNLEEIVVSAGGSRNIAHEQKLRTEIIEKYSDRSLGDALKEIAGVSALKTGNVIVKPIINGLHSSRVPVIANNVRLEDQQWGTEHAPNLDINSAGKVSVIKGAGTLQYGGDAIGGIVLVDPVVVLKDTLYGKTIISSSTNGLGSSITSSLHRGNEKGWAWNVNGTFKYFGDRTTPDYVLSNTGNRESNFAGDVKYIGNNYNLSVTYSFYDATIGIAKATHIGSTGDLVTAINSRQPAIIEPFTYSINAPRQEVRHHLAKINYNRQFSEKSSLALQYAFQLNHRQEYDIRRANYIDKPALDLTLTTHSLQADWKQEEGSSTFKTGINGSVQHNEASPETGIRPLIPTYNKFDAGAYGIYTYTFSQSLSAEAGARYDFSHMDADKFYQKSRWNSLGYSGKFDNFITADYGTQWLTNPTFTFHNFSGSLGVRKELSTGISLLGNVSLAMRNPNPSELFSDGLHHSNGTIELGDLNTTKEKAVKVSATLLKSSDTFSFEVTPYLNHISNFIYLSPTGIEYTIRGSFPVYKYMHANAVLAGIDVHADWNIIPNLKYSFNGTYVYGQNNDADTPLIDMPPLNLTNTLRYTKEEWQHLFMELRSEAVFAQSRYPDTNFYTDVPHDGELVPVLVDISTPPPGYHLLHFTSGIQFKAFKNSTASVGLAINNIFNTNYRDYLNRQRLYTDEVGRNFQLQIKFNY